MEYIGIVDYHFIIDASHRFITYGMWTLTAVNVNIDEIVESDIRILGTWFTNNGI